ncbi:MAG: PEGA domain-containing protein [Bacteroidales bacterium]|nr:PEGA domain-containing protein [Bacteroidales bacterium]
MIRLDAPLPFKGSLVVESTPDIADLYIDNDYVGQTPKLINDIVVGQHELRLTKEGYKEYTGSIIVKKNERTQVEPKLEALPKPKPKKEEKPKKPKPVPVNDSIKTQGEKSVWFATANAAYSFAPQASFGFSVGQVKRFGWFFSAMSNFGFKAMQYNYTADANGYVDGEYPYYTGEKCNMRISVMGGAMMKAAEPLYLRAGVGYGQRVKSWYTKDGQLVKMSDDSWTGVDVSLGAQLHLKGFVLSLEAVTTSFKDVEGKVGVGYAF